MAKFYYNEQEVTDKFAISEKTTYPTFQKHFPEAFQTVCSLKQQMSFVEAKKFAENMTDLAFGKGNCTLLFFTISGKKLRIISVRKGGAAQ